MNVNDLIERLRYEAVISDRPGQMDRLNALADEFAATLADREGRQQDKLDAARWRYIRRKLCLTGNGDGACAMQAINLPANIQGWPEPGQVAEFCDAAIEAALSKENKV